MNGPRRTVVVVGTGYIGARLARLLVDSGHRVTGLKRTGAGSVTDGVEVRVADVTDPESLERVWPDRVDDLVFCLARGPNSGQGYEIYANGLSRILEEVRRRGQPMRRAVFVSSTGVYAQQDGEWVDERSATEPTSEAGRAMLLAESVLRDFPCESVAIRFSGLYGPGRARLVRAVRAASDQPVRAAAAWLNQLHQWDAVGVMQHLLDLPNPDPLYLATDCEPALRADVLEWLAEEMALPIPQGVAGARNANIPRGNKRCRNQRLLDSGYCFRFPTYREGYRQILAD